MKSIMFSKELFVICSSVAQKKPVVLTLPYFGVRPAAQSMF